MTTQTRCPGCQTAFRITTDQLVSRQGMVRCGQCSKVFNALEHLVEPLPRDEEADAQGTDAAATNYDLFGAPDSQTEPAPAAAPQPPPSSSLLAGSERTRRGFPWFALAGAVLATAALAGQAAWFYRNQIAAQYPAAKPALEAACLEIGCRIDPPIDPQAISIESSDLQADQVNRAVLVLSAVLRNRATFAQGLPLLELSLTDAQDQPVARRVLKPAEYAPEAAAPTIGAGSEMQLRVHLDAGQLKANGYRLYAFYP